MPNEVLAKSISERIARSFGEGHISSLANVFLPITFFFVAIGPQGLTWLPGVFALCIWISMRINKEYVEWNTFFHRLMPFLIPLIIFLTWAVIRSFWTPIPGDARLMMNSFLLATCLILLSSALVKSIKHRGPWNWAYFPAFTLIASLVLIAILTLLIFIVPQGGTGKRLMQMWHYNRASLFIALLWPLSIFAISQMKGSSKTRFLLFWGTTLVVTLAVFISWSESAKLALVVIFLLYSLTRLTPYFSQRLLAAGSFISIFIILPLIHAAYHAINPTKQDILESSSIGRISIWEGQLEPIRSSPWFGNGVEYVRLKGYFDPVLGERLFPTHPHSALVQVWVDLGAIGAVSLAICFVTAIMLVRLSDRSVVALYLPLLGGILTIWSVSHGMWQSWYVGLAGMMIVFAIHSHMRRIYETEIGSNP
jgi:O-antigen ligase